MPPSITDQVILITGSASGIGLATAHLLLEHGAWLALCDISKESTEKFFSELDESQKKRVITGVVDIADRSAVAAFHHLAKETFGKVNGIASIAGTAGRKLGHQEIWEIDTAEYDFVMDVNVRGAFNILSEAMRPGFLEPGASIVHTASMFAKRGFAKGSIYSASKHATVGLVESAALEAGKHGSRVNLVLPGPIDTPMLRGNEESGAEGTSPSVALGRLGKPLDVANVIVFLLSDKAAFVTGATWSVDGGANA